MENPFMKAVTLTDNAAHNLYDLLRAIGIKAQSIPEEITELQLSIDSANLAGSLYVGNSDLSTTMWGRKIIYGIRDDVIGTLAPFSIKQVYLLTDAVGDLEATPYRIGITAIQR